MAFVVPKPFPEPAALMGPAAIGEYMRGLLNSTSHGPSHSMRLIFAVRGIPSSPGLSSEAEEERVVRALN